MDKVIDVPVAVQRHVPMVVETVQFFDKVIDVPVWVQTFIKRVEVPQMQFCVAWTSL